jgi:putative MATE family efflux protein
MTEKLSQSELLRRLWSMSWPTVLYSLLESAVGLTDIFLASFMGDPAVAAIGFSQQIYLVLMIGTLSITTGTITLVSQSFGARRYETASSLASHSLYLSIYAGLAIGAAGVLLAPFSLALLGAEGEALREGAAYLRVLMGGVVFLLIDFSANGIFRALGDTVSPLKISAQINVLNVLFSYAFMFGPGPFPACGVMGAAIGTVIARAAGAAIAIRKLTKARRQVRVSMRIRQNTSMFRGILNIGLPSGFAGFFRNGARILFFHVLATTALGTAAAAVASIGFQIRMFAIMPALAFQVAAAALVGHAIGARKIGLAEAYGWTAVKYGVAAISLESLLVFLFPGWIVGWFTDSAEIVAMGRTALRLIALEQLCSCASIIASGVLSGAGDTRPAMRYTIFSQWMLMLPVAYALAHYTPLGVDGAWMAWGFAPALQAYLTLRRFIRGHWKTLAAPGSIVDEFSDL